MTDVYDGIHHTPDYQNNGIMFLSVENISTLTSDKFISRDFFEQNYKIFPEKGDILLTRIGNVGTPNVVESTDKLAYYVSLALLKAPKINSYFLCNLICTQEFKKELHKKTLTTAIPQKINKDEIRKITFFDSTSSDERNKIGSLLKKITCTITLHEEKKRQLERLKSALLQKMFADKSGYPAIRFKGLDDIWDQEKLSSLVRLHRGLTYSPNNVQDSGIRVLRSSNILDGQFVITDDDIFVKSSVVNIPTVKNGDILITAANGSIKLVGKHAIISGISENTAVSGGFMLVGSSRIPDFVNSLFDTSWYQRFIRKYVTGGNGSIGNLKKNDLDKQYVKVPTTSEQERIGEFFRKIDQLIINNQIKHEKLLELKKSLLQNMFI